jgi:predicted MPP superfamily phosphohydrolase
VKPFALIALLLITADLAWWWKSDSLLRHARNPGRWRVFLACFMGLVVGGLASLLALRASGHFSENAFPSVLFALVYVWHLVVLPPLILLWILSALLGKTRKLLRPSPPLPRPTPAPEPLGALPRRTFLGAALTASPALIALGATARGLSSLDHFRIRRLEVPLASLPPSIDGLSIAHVSDSHVGRFTHGRVLEQIVHSTNALDADLVLFTGDLVNYSLDDLPAGLELLKGFRARHGVVAVEGNHDLLADPRRFRKETAAAIPLLVNESLHLNLGASTIELLGLAWGGSVESLLQKRQNPGALPLLLAHHPHAFDQAEGVPLTLSGHTHGGQLMLNERLGVGPAMFRYWSGLYRKNQRALVVSNGVGNWFPLRTHAPAEITHLILRRAEPT